MTAVNPTPDGSPIPVANTNTNRVNRATRRDSDTETPAQRAMRMSAAAHQSWANTADRSARARRGYDGLVAKFEREIDPDGTLPPAERAKRVKSRLKRHYAEIQRKSSIARSKPKSA